MKTIKKLAALMLALSMLLLSACAVPVGPTDVTTDDPAVTTGEPITPAPDQKVYNIVFALATIPPVLAALDCIENGNETYAIIERGKTYSGIDKLENFHNAGFDPANNLSAGFTPTEFNAMVEKVKELRAENENTFFNFYVQDGTALRGAAIAANAGLPREDFVIYMCEDGTGAYNALKTSYLTQEVSDGVDGPYDSYAAAVKTASEQFEAIMASKENQNSDVALRYNIGKAYALAALPNFVYYLQEPAIVENALTATSTDGHHTKLLTSFAIEGYDDEVEYRLNLKYSKISDGIKRLTEAQRTDYLTLMYGDYYADTYAALTRTEAAGKSVPSKKLVFIGSRHGGYPKFASNAAYGIGGLGSADTVPDSYDELPEKYKMSLLFPAKEDYDAFLSVLADGENYPADIDLETAAKIQTAVFNLYIDYIFNLKLTALQYGGAYDIIMKGHPREAIGCHNEWGGRYKLTVGEGDAAKTYVYDKLVDAALLAFHGGDSLGKYIGMVPYGTAAENLAYLGADIAIAGLPSSTYSGYDTDVDVLFILAETGENITGAASQVKERYEAGNLTYNDNGTERDAAYYNTGNVLKTVSAIAERGGDSALSERYDSLFASWLKSVHGDSATDINEQGFPVAEQ